jgi:transcriptional regulator with XRE-family HTH domain
MAKRIDPQHLEFAARVRAIRTSLGLTQTEFAKRLGKPQSYLSKIESCEKRVDVIEALSICKALGVTLDVLLPVEVIQFLVPRHDFARKRSSAHKRKHG